MGKACNAHEKGCDQQHCPACILATEKEEIIQALKDLMDAQRALFRSSLFTAFRAGKSEFMRAWNAAERYAQPTQPEEPRKD
jgi:hypothetical protein